METNETRKGKYSTKKITKKKKPEHILLMCGLSLGLGFRVYARPKTLNPHPK
jgi:hypothetical protein